MILDIGQDFKGSIALTSKNEDVQAGQERMTPAALLINMLMIKRDHPTPPESQTTIN
jgi:hypothetical protein